MENSGGATSKEGPPAYNMSCQPLRNGHAGIHLGWEMHIPLGRTLSQTRNGDKEDGNRDNLENYLHMSKLNHPYYRHLIPSLLMCSSISTLLLISTVSIY